MSAYKYVVEGKAADGQSYTCEGTVEAPFPEVFTVAMKAAFQQLTQGKAVYGKPGVGCRGPYTITKVVIEAVT